MFVDGTTTPLSLWLLITEHITQSAQCSDTHSRKRSTMPEIVRRYNTSMGGVDILDKLLSSYRPRLRSKEWWCNLFSNALNLTVVAAWQLHRELHKDDSTALSHLDFRRD
ncbi:PiggyBac transposable element-derived protein 1, partial [Trichinella sp. T6]